MHRESLATVTKEISSGNGTCDLFGATLAPSFVIFNI
jgi:hypothetical protein